MRRWSPGDVRHEKSDAFYNPCGISWPTGRDQTHSSEHIMSMRHLGCMYMNHLCFPTSSWTIASGMRVDYANDDTCRTPWKLKIRPLWILPRNLRELATPYHLPSQALPMSLHLYLHSDVVQCSRARAKYIWPMWGRSSSFYLHGLVE